MNFKTIGIIILSLVWLFVSVKQWAFDYPDLSSLIFALGFFFVGLFIAFFFWYHEAVEGMENDIKAIDEKANKLEVKLIELIKIVDEEIPNIIKKIK